jgi:hypothetical protein
MSEEKGSAEFGSDEPTGSDNDWEDISRIIHKFVPGEPLEGLVLGSEPVTEGKYAGKSLRWSLEIPEGYRVSFIAGQSFDNLMALRRVTTGAYLRIELLGQKTLPDGRKVNEWKVLRRKKPTSVGGKEATPF